LLCILHFALFLVLHDLCDIPAPPAPVVLLYLYTLSQGFLDLFSGGSSPSTVWDRRKKKAVFICQLWVQQSPPGLLLVCLFLCESDWEGSLFHRPPQTPPKACGASGGEGRLCFPPPASAQLCCPRFAGAWKAASQSCQHGLEIARMGQVGRRFHAKI